MTQLARVLIALLLASISVAQGKNLLFYGSSYTYYSWGYGVPELVREIATEAGHPTPTIVAALVGGSTLQFHATDPAQMAVISNALPAGQTWDNVVLQAGTLEATDNGGYTAAQFRSNSVAITANVRAHSPTARTVMYQTWASSWGDPNYPLGWPTPLQMHEEIRGNYQLATSDIEATFGVGSAANAAVGDGLALLQWDPSYYEVDMNHPTPRMILLAGMCIYTSIYGETVCAIAPDFQGSSPLVAMLAAQGLGANEWNQMAGIADRCADRALRAYPGSGDYLLLETAAGNGPKDACPRKAMTIGTNVSMQVRSLNGIYDNAPCWMLVDVFPTGSPPGAAANFPEIQVNLGRMSILGTSMGLANPLSFALQMPFSWPGTSVLVQGLAWQPSPATGSSLFTTTDAHEFAFF
ncbi:MAG: SGNH/GDSL hydrolase family protein [Planctomycetes bacterium]|nr:SGNH/GDSL hydrolase family protein [Planctomycetota bacterium]